MKHKNRLPDQWEAHKLSSKFNQPIAYKEEKSKKWAIVIGVVLVIACAVYIKLTT